MVKKQSQSNAKSSKFNDKPLYQQLLYLLIPLLILHYILRYFYSSPTKLALIADGIILLVCMLIVVAFILRHRSKAQIKNTFKCLFTKEIPFWSPATFFIASGMFVGTVIALFLPFGTLEGKEQSLLELSKISFTLAWMLVIVGFIGVIIGIIKKSWLASWLTITCAEVGLMLVTDFYQDLVGKPFLISVNVLAIVGTVGIVVFIMGSIIIISSLLDEHYFELSKY